MLLESVQILNGALYERELVEKTFYGKTHSNHPCVQWAAASWANFEWLVRLTHYLNEEYLFRYDHDESHTSYQKMIANWYDGECWELPTVDQSRDEFVKAMPDEITAPDSIDAYREYYREYKQSEDWFEYNKGRDSPDWL